MVVTAAATSVLSLYVVPAFADSSHEETSGDSLGALSDTPAALPADSVLHALGNGPASAGPDTSDVSTAPDLSPLNSRVGGPKTSGSQGAARDSASADGREQGVHGHDSGYGDDGGHGRDSGYGDGGGYGGDGGHGRDSGYGDAAGYGDDYGYGGYGDTPPTKPPTTPPASPPSTTPPVSHPPTTPPVSHPPTTPPVKSPPTSAPPTVPGGIPPRKPPTSPPTQPPSLPETGGNEQVLAASGIAALLLTSGAVLYRRGRAASGR
ncbi:LPXTG cell wall anchor domain-containing protein [Streptomyces sp. TG1A-60]|uniref:LPXTG cell wall anchor domain-containing protein n=1 Tax=Streptomyces sp. TG1A-60 TaxID=3129111 RepID=UPI0030CAE1D9